MLFFEHTLSAMLRLGVMLRLGCARDLRTGALGLDAASGSLRTFGILELYLSSISHSCLVNGKSNVARRLGLSACLLGLRKYFSRVKSLPAFGDSKTSSLSCFSFCRDGLAKWHTKASLFGEVGGLIPIVTELTFTSCSKSVLGPVTRSSPRTGLISCGASTSGNALSIFMERLTSRKQF